MNRLVSRNRSAQFSKQLASPLLQAILANWFRNWEKFHSYLENLPPILPVMHLRSGQLSYIILRACHFCSLLPACREVSLAIEPMCNRTHMYPSVPEQTAAS